MVPVLYSVVDDIGLFFARNFTDQPVVAGPVVDLPAPRPAAAPRRRRPAAALGSLRERLSGALRLF